LHGPAHQRGIVLPCAGLAFQPAAKVDHLDGNGAEGPDPTKGGCRPPFDPPEPAHGGGVR
jgi:hypothetical protein